MPRSRYLDADIRVCPTQVACDGSTITTGREMCGACERYMERKARQGGVVLRGERYLAYAAGRNKR